MPYAGASISLGLIQSSLNVAPASCLAASAAKWWTELELACIASRWTRPRASRRAFRGGGAPPVVAAAAAERKTATPSAVSASERRITAAPPDDREEAAGGVLQAGNKGSLTPG